MITQGSFLGVVKWPGREADNSPPSSTEVKNKWSYISNPPYVFMAWYLVKHGDKLTFSHEWRVGKYLERETTVVYLKALPALGWKQKTTATSVGTTGGPAGMRTMNLPNTSVER
jgi:hypothetical protein